MSTSQLLLFPAAPATERYGGRKRFRGTLAALVAGARTRGCTHLEVSPDGLLFVDKQAVGRVPGASYLLLTHPRLLDVLARRTARAALRLAIQI